MRKHIVHNMDPNEVQDLIRIFETMPAITLTGGQQLRTYKEMKTSFENLSNADNRMKVLQDELERLAAQKDNSMTQSKDLAKAMEVEASNQNKMHAGVRAVGGVIGVVADATTTCLAEVVTWPILAGTQAVIKWGLSATFFPVCARRRKRPWRGRKRQKREWRVSGLSCSGDRLTRLSSRSPSRSLKS